jgi:hypothetical protein
MDVANDGILQSFKTSMINTLYFGIDQNDKFWQIFGLSKCVLFTILDV